LPADLSSAAPLATSRNPLVTHVGGMASPLSTQKTEAWKSLLRALRFNNSIINMTEPQAYHWRTAGGAEVDIVLERDGRLYPVEVKCKTSLTKEDARGLRAFRETYPRARVMRGLVLYAGTECYALDPHTVALPWNADISA